jgi:hypothetical protein
VQVCKWILWLFHFARCVSSVHELVRVNHANHNRDDDGHHDGDYNGHDVLANGHADGEPFRVAISVANVYTDCFAVCRANRGSFRSPERVTDTRSNCDPNSIAQCITQRNPNDISHRSTVGFTKRCAVCDPNRFTHGSTECCSVCVTHWRAQRITHEGTHSCSDCDTKCGTECCSVCVAHWRSHRVADEGAHSCSDCGTKRSTELITKCFTHGSAQRSANSGSDSDTHRCPDRNAMLALALRFRYAQ